MDAFAEEFLNWEVMVRYFPDIVAGLWVTMYLALMVIVTGLILGLVLAVIRAFQINPINLFIIAFVDIFRSLPPLVIIILLYFSIPMFGLNWSGFICSWIALSLVLASFVEEIYWAGITSVHKGQWEAARSTGLSFFETLIYVVLPQVIRMTIPPLTNRTIVIAKNTALASVVAVQEMLTVAQTSLAYAANSSPLTLAALGYLLMFLPLVILSRYIESRFAWKR
jgi:polar amino acid transport system permease protein